MPSVPCRDFGLANAADQRNPADGGHSRPQTGSRVIIVSGYADVQVMREAFENGAIAFLEKPLDATDLAKVLDYVATNN